MVSAWVTGALQGFEKGFAQQELAKNKAISQAILLKDLQRKIEEDTRKESVRQKQKQFFTDYPKYQGKIDDLTKQYGSAKTETALRQLPKIQAQAKERESLESLDWGSEFGFDFGVAPKYQKERLTVPQAEKRALQEDIKSIVGQGVKGIEETTRKKRAKIEKDIKELRSLIISAAGGAELPEFAKNFAKGITTQLFQKPKTQKQIDKDLIKQALLNNKTMDEIDKLAIRTGKYKYNVNPSLNRAAFFNALKGTSRFIDIAMGEKAKKELDELRKVNNHRYIWKDEKGKSRRSFAAAFKDAYGAGAGIKKIGNKTIGLLFAGLGNQFTNIKVNHANTFANILENDLFDIFTGDKERRVFKTEINNIKRLLPSSLTGRFFENTTAVVGTLAKIQEDLEDRHKGFLKDLESAFITTTQKSKIRKQAAKAKRVLEKLGPFKELYNNTLKTYKTSEKAMNQQDPRKVPSIACGKDGYINQRYQHRGGQIYVCTIDGWAKEK
jgi:hypothetical protein